jgi:hypothetical protein
MSDRARLLILLALVGTATLLVFSRPPIPQPLAYHDFADRRSWFGVPNFMDVLSNAPLGIVGLWGLFAVTRRRFAELVPTSAVRWSYIVFFLGLVLTGFGSGYYHLHPTNARLVWDRLPMTLAFMGILSALIAERISARGIGWVLAALVAAGVFSVWYWWRTELHGRGDLRPYILVQFGSLLALLAIFMLYRSRYQDGSYLLLAFALYGAAKLLEVFDPEVYRAVHAVSGHTLKHFCAAGAGLCVALMLRHRTTQSETSAISAQHEEAARPKC